MRNSSSLDWLRFMHTPNDYRVSRRYPAKIVTVYNSDSVTIPSIYRHYYFLGLSIWNCTFIHISEYYA